MGTVYRAEDPRTGQQVAVKVLRPEVERNNPDVAARFLREVEAAQSLRDPRIIQVFDHGRTDEGLLYLAMELCSGDDLAARIRKGPLAVQEACAIGAEIAKALAHAHSRGVVHRDLKPPNVLLGPDGPKLVDFGVARLASAPTRLTVGNVILGTPEYMSPEQAKNLPDVDGRADLYSLGAILYEALTGSPPFVGDGPLSVLVKVLTEEPRPLSSLRLDVPREVEALVASLMIKDRDRRRTDAAGIAADLEALARPSAPIAPRTTRPPELESEMRIVTVVAVLDLGDPRALSAVIRKEGGVEEDLGGGELLAVLGSGVTLGDEPVRACRVALAARASPTARIGVATGRARATSSGEVAGSVIEQAVRLAESAAPGMVLACAATAEAVRGLFRMRRTSTGGWELHSARVGGIAVRTARTTFVGRDREFGRLVGLWTRAVMDGVPQAIIVTGIPGIGKTRLKDELRGRIEAGHGTVTTLEARGDLLRANMPFVALADALRTRIAPRAVALGVNTVPPERDTMPERSASVSPQPARWFGDNEVVAPAGAPAPRVSVVDDLAPHLERHALQLGLTDAQARTVAAVLGGEPGRRPSRSAPDARARALEGLVAALLGEASSAPTLVVVEDLQWIDADSLAALERALREGHGKPLVVLALTRPELLDASPSIFSPVSGIERTVIRLGPIDGESARALVTEVLEERGITAAPELVALIQEQGAGTPLYLQELAACAAAGTSSVPLSLETALQSHFDQLTHSEREVCKRAAVLGLTFWDAAIEWMGGTDVARALARLQANEIVARRATTRFAGAAELSFVHALFRDAAYAQLPEEQRAPLHREAAEWLQKSGEPDPTILAHHFARAGELPRAAAELLRAAESALGTYANASAAATASSALALPAEPATRFAALAVREEALHRMGRRSDDGRDVTLLLEAARTAPQRLLALSRKARLARTVGDLQTARAALEEALENARVGGTTADVAELTTQLGDVALAQGDPPAAVELAGAALHAAEASESATARSHAMWLRARATAEAGALGPSLGSHRQALDLFAAGEDRETEAACLLSAADVELRCGQPGPAVESLQRARRVAGRMLGKEREAYLEQLLGLALAALGRGGEARIAANKAVELGERLGSPADRAVGLLALARAEGVLGSAEGMIDAANEALEIVREARLEDLGVAVRVELARAQLACGDVEQAWRLGEHALRARLERPVASTRCGDDELWAVVARCRSAVGDHGGAAVAARTAWQAVQATAAHLADGPDREQYLASPWAENARRLAHELESSPTA
jgi:tetratricopeptide (TPR) repeat protein